MMWEETGLGHLYWNWNPIVISETHAYWEEAYLQVQPYKRELMFLKLIWCCFATWDDTDANSRSMFTTLEGICDDLKERIDDDVLWKSEPRKQDWDLLASFSEGTIQQSKSLIVDYCHVLLDSSLKYKALPSDETLQFLQLILHNLEVLVKYKADVIPPFKNFIIKVDKIFELQIQQKEMWLEVIDVAYRIQHVINSCSVLLYPIWYNMACLSDILYKAEDVKRKLEKDENMHYSEVLFHSVQSNAPQDRTWFPTTTEEVIGVEEETGKIIDERIWGCKSLGIVSIIGMCGLGKTTLVKQVYNSPSVRRHFHKFRFCHVSQVHSTRRLLLDILSGMIEYIDKISSMTEDDLAHRKCLSGQKYLLVLDDIWDVKAWDEVKRSFPDDKNGSRVIFTTRERKVALDAQSNVHDLHSLSDDESFELLHEGMRQR